MASYFAGLDLAQASDYSALVVCQHITEYAGLEPHRIEPVIRLGHLYRVDHVRRWRGSSYLDVVEEVVSLLGHRDRRDEVLLCYDKTGLGGVVKDMLLDAYRDQRLRHQPLGITITAAAARSFYNPAKAHLMENLEVLAQGHRVQVTDLPLAPALRDELEHFQRRAGATGHVRMEAAGSGHDDLVLALALAVWPNSQIDYFGRGYGEPSHIDANGRLWPR
jgi:hypothetical protein